MSNSTKETCENYKDSFKLTCLTCWFREGIKQLLKLKYSQENLNALKEIIHQIPCPNKVMQIKRKANKKFTCKRNTINLVLQLNTTKTADTQKTSHFFIVYR